MWQGKGAGLASQLPPNPGMLKHGNTKIASQYTIITADIKKNVLTQINVYVHVDE